MDVRTAAPSDADGLTALIPEAFATDPLWTWDPGHGRHRGVVAVSRDERAALPDRVDRRRLRGRRVRQAGSFTTPDGACTVATMWRDPARVPTAVRR